MSRTHAIPDEPSELIVWLEQHVFDLNLRQRLGEPSSLLALDEVKVILGPLLQPLLAEGLAALQSQPERLRPFAACPKLLLGLQRLLFVEGGPVWALPSAPEANVRQEAGEVVAPHPPFRLFLGPVARKGPHKPLGHQL